MNAELKNLIDSIGPLDARAMEQAQKRLDRLTKPLGSLGRIEELAKWLAGVTGDVQPRITKKVIFVFAADHGVAAEGVSAYPQAVTEQMVYNFLRGGAAINVLARQAKAEVVVADFGVAAQMAPAPGLLSCKIGLGTKNMAKEPAMTIEEAESAILEGAKIAAAHQGDGTACFATGDMGIGNTTSASALAAALTQISVRDAVGRGTGIDDEALERKVNVIERALSLHDVDPTHPLSVLAQVGGFEIAGLVGVILAGAAARTPVVIDGFISGAAALAACRLCPAARSYLLAAHLSVERGHRHILNYLRLKPLLEFDMRLGEGTGAALVLPMMDAACAIMNEMATFEEAGVSEKEPDREKVS